jgi:DNA-binding NtrC family response regulator
VARLFRPGDTVLVVDDDAAFLSLLETALRRKGCSVVVAGSVAEAVGVLERDPVDTIVSDYSMPAATGMNLLAYVRTRRLEARFVLVSGALPPEAARAAEAAGAILSTKHDLVGSLTAAAA